MEAYMSVAHNSKTLRKFFLKATSLVVIQAFLLSNIAFAAPAAKAQAPLASHEEIAANPENIVIPREFGLVKSKFTGNSGRLIVHIQDAHCNYEAQSNIAHILENLIKNYDVNLVSVEGADGIIDTSWFKAFPDDDVRKEVADYFMKKGEITGPEFLSITTEYPIKLFGAETRSYYLQNLNAFTESYPLKADTEKYFTNIKKALNRLKGYIYNEGLKSMDSTMQDYESKKVQFNDYVRYLQGMAEKHKVNLRQFDNFFRIVNVLIYEKKIDFNVTDKERGALIDSLSKDLSKERLQDLVAKSIAFKSGKISSADYYNYLKTTAIQNGVDLAKTYPNLYNYIIYNSVYSKIENEKLFEDIKKLETAIKEKLFENDDQRALDKLSHNVEILLGLINIKLLNGDYGYFESHKGEFSYDAFKAFIEKKSAQFGLAYDIEPPTEAVAKSIPKLEDFYSIAIKRDKALVDNTLGAMKKEKQKVSVLITGGFHSEGIAKLLEKQGVSYLVVCPSITKDVPTPYIQILTNQRTSIEDILVKPVHAEEKLLAAPSKVQLIMMSQKGLDAYLRDVAEGAALKVAIEGLGRNWIQVYVNGIRLGIVNIDGYIKHTCEGVGGVSQSALDISNDFVGKLIKRCEELELRGQKRQELVDAVTKELNEGTVRQQIEAEMRRRLGAKQRAVRPTPGTGQANARAGNAAPDSAMVEAVLQAAISNEKAILEESHVSPFGGEAANLLWEEAPNFVSRYYGEYISKAAERVIGSAKRLREEYGITYGQIVRGAEAAIGSLVEQSIVADFGTMIGANRRGFIREALQNWIGSQLTARFTDQVIAKKFAESKAHVEAYPGMRQLQTSEGKKALEIVNIDGYAETLEAEGLPVAAVPGRGGYTDGVSRGLMRVYLDSYWVSNATPGHLSPNEIDNLARHELAHLDIFNFEELDQRMVSGEISDSEYEMRTKENLIGYFTWQAWVKAGKPYGQAQEDFINGELNNALFRQYGKRCSVTSKLGGALSIEEKLGALVVAQKAAKVAMSAAPETATPAKNAVVNKYLGFIRRDPKDALLNDTPGTGRASADGISIESLRQQLESDKTQRDNLRKAIEKARESGDNLVYDVNTGDLWMFLKDAEDGLRKIEEAIAALEKLLSGLDPQSGKGGPTPGTGSATAVTPADEQDLKNKTQNLKNLRDVVAASAGVQDVVAIVNPGDKDAVFQSVTTDAPAIFRADGNVAVSVHEEKTRRGQFLGLLDALMQWIKGTAKRKGMVGLGIMMPGKGTRMSPITQHLFGIKPFMAMLVRPSEKSGWLTGTSASLYTWNLVCYHLGRLGFSGWAWKWGDEPQISANVLAAVSQSNLDLRDADIVRFGARSLITDELANNKEWLNADANGNLTGWARRRERSALVKKLYPHGVADTPDLKAMVHIGSPAFSDKFLKAASEAFDGVEQSVWLDVDGYLIEGLTLDKDAWETERARDKGIDAVLKQCPDFYERCRDIVRRLGGKVNIKVVDFGEGLYWGDIGLLSRSREALYQVALDTPQGEFARQLACITDAKIDKWGNRIVGNCVYPQDGSVRNSVLIDSRIYGDADIDGAVIVNSALGHAQIRKGSVVYESTVADIAMGERAFSYGSISEKLDVAADYVHTSIPKDLAHPEAGMEDWRADSKVDVGAKDNYEKPVFGNPRSYEAEQARMRQRDIPIKSIEDGMKRFAENLEKDKVRKVQKGTKQYAGVTSAPAAKPTPGVGRATAKISRGLSVNAQNNRTAAWERAAQKYAELQANAPMPILGTSGERGNHQRFLTDARIITMQAGNLSMLAQRYGVRPGDAIVFAGDLRPSTPRLARDAILSTLQQRFKVNWQGFVSTPTVVFWATTNGTPMVSIMITASHNPVRADNETAADMPSQHENNGLKLNSPTGEVYKEDEPFLLEHIKEAEILQFTIPDDQDLCGRDGKLKTEGLSAEQRQLLGIVEGIFAHPGSESQEAYRLRNTTNMFGKVFDGESIGFNEHTGVGRDALPEIFEAVGLDVRRFGRDTDNTWPERMDTEDLDANIERHMIEEAARLKDAGVNVISLNSTDGDADRPALFDSKGNFIYGDKICGLVCIFLKKLFPQKDFVVVVTATCSEAMVKLLREKYGMKVIKVEVGSPYVVSEMEKQEKLNKDAVVVGFERNTGFFIQTPMKLPNGNTIQKLATRDSAFVILAVNLFAKQAGMKTLEELVDSEYNGEYESYSWSGGVTNTTPGCEAYTAPMGKAIMRSLSPRSRDMLVVEFGGHEEVYYTMRDEYYGIAAAKGKNAADAEVKSRMLGIHAYLSGIFTKEMGFGSIFKMEFIDGVRVFFDNGEIVHLRPSGNEPKWRIYPESPLRKGERAREISEMRKAVYPQMITDYVRKTTTGTKRQIAPRPVAGIMASLKKLLPSLAIPADGKLITWSMSFGPEGEHFLQKGINFAADGQSFTIYSRRIHNRSMPSRPRGTLEVSLTAYPEGQLVVYREIKDGKTVMSVECRGEKAWMELGVGLDKNVPVGKFLDMIFPVLPQELIDALKAAGAVFLRPLDVTSEEELEPTLWGPEDAGQFEYRPVAGTATTAADVGALSEEIRPPAGDIGARPRMSGQGGRVNQPVADIERRIAEDIISTEKLGAGVLYGGEDRTAAKRLIEDRYYEAVKRPKPQANDLSQQAIDDRNACGRILLLIMRGMTTGMRNDPGEISADRVAIARRLSAEIQTALAGAPASEEALHRAAELAQQWAAEVYGAALPSAGLTGEAALVMWQQAKDRGDQIAQPLPVLIGPASRPTPGTGMALARQPVKGSRAMYDEAQFEQAIIDSGRIIVSEDVSAIDRGPIRAEALSYYQDTYMAPSGRTTMFEQDQNAVDRAVTGIINRVQAMRVSSRLPAQEATRDFYASQGVEGIGVDTATGALTVSSSPDYKDRGQHDTTYMHRRGLVLPGLIMSRGLLRRHMYECVYSMNHGIWRIMEFLAQLARSLGIDAAVLRIHDTFFPQVSPLFAGTIQYQVTGGHYQANVFGAKYTTEGRGVQYLVKFNIEKTRQMGIPVIEDVIRQDMTPGKWVYELPGYVDFVVNYGNLRFNDVSRPMTAEELADAGIKADTSKEAAQFHEGLVSMGMAHVFYMYNGKPRIAMNPQFNFNPEVSVTSIRVVDAGRPVAAGAEVSETLFDLYRNRPETVGKILSAEGLTAVMARAKRGAEVETIEPVSEREYVRNVAQAKEFYQKLDQYVSAGQPIPLKPNVRSGLSTSREGYNWGKPWQTSNILAGLGITDLAEAVAKGIMVEGHDVVSERWIATGDVNYPSMIEMGTEYTAPLQTLFGNYPEETFGKGYLAQNGPKLSTMAKEMDLGTSFSVQIHRPKYIQLPNGELREEPNAKPEAWVALPQYGVNKDNISRAAMGYSADGLTRQTLSERLTAGDMSILNVEEMPVGQPFNVLGGLTHSIAFGSFVFEVSREPREQAKATLSFADKGMGLPGEKPKEPRKGKDFSNMSEGQKSAVLDIHEAAGMLRKSKKSDYTLPVIPPIHKSGASTHSVMIADDNYIVEKFLIKAGERMPLDKILTGRPVGILVRSGSVTGFGEGGKSLGKITEILNTAGSRVRELMAVEDAEVWLEYAPSPVENAMYAAFHAGRNEAARLKSDTQKREPFNVYAPQQFYQGEQFAFERKLLQALSGGLVTLRQYSSLEDLKGVDPSKDVVITTNNLVSQAQSKLATMAGDEAAALRAVLAARMLAFDRADHVRSYGFAREAEIAGLMLGDTTAADIETASDRAVELAGLLTRMSASGRIITMNDLKDLLAAAPGATPDVVNDRVRRILSDLLLTVPIQRYEIDREAVESRRQALWSA